MKTCAIFAVANALVEATSGRCTYYHGGGNLGACGTPVDDNMPVCAVSAADGGKAHCGQTIYFSNSVGSGTCQVLDLCPGCEAGHIDMTLSAFNHVCTTTQGTCPITWSFAGSSMVMHSVVSTQDPVGAMVDAATSGRCTYYHGGGNLGACGTPVDDNVPICAVSAADGGKAHCGQTISFSNAMGSGTCQVRDLCPGCEAGHIDMTLSAFNHVCTTTQGTCPITWSFTGSTKVTKSVVSTQDPVEAMADVEASGAYVTYHEQYSATFPMTSCACSNLPYSTVGAAGYPDVTAMAGVTYDSSLCGSIITVTGPAGSASVRVIDGCGSIGSMHFDLAYPAFMQVCGNAGYAAGHCTANYAIALENSTTVI